MIHGLTMGNTRVKTLVGAIILATATMAHAGTPIVGGGATLPSLGYVGSAAATQKQVNPASTNSFFGVYTAQRGAGNPAVSYCLTGSGTGKNILAGVSGTNVQNACPNTGTITGFGAATAGRTDLTQPDFAAADSPLSLTDYSNYTANHTTSKPVQFPSVAGAVAIAFNKVDDQGTTVTSVNLNDTQICKVFSGQIVSWNDTGLAGAISLPSGHTISGPINVQYRSDGSGTTFAFSNHLSAVCGGTASAHFVTDQAFTTVVSKYQPTIPGNWTGSSGNAAVATAIKAASGNLGYVEAANSVAAGVNFALVGGLSPITNFADPTTHKVTVTNSTDVVYNMAINGADPTTGAALVQAIPSAPTTQCIALVKPSTYANPASGYPIIAISYLLGNSTGNGVTGDLANNQKLLGAPYNTAITGSATLTTIGANTGLAFLNSSFTSSQASACLTN